MYRKSAEDYLEAMLILREKKGYIRSSDIAMQLGVSKPSVSAAVKLLMDGGFVRMDDGKLLSLTETGTEIAGKIYERHCVLKDILVAVGVEEETAEEEACGIEHELSDDSFQKLRSFWEKHT